tara:strand:- start:12877 stop:14496 length:1620 start_codon:yes stop_codon:yes gene_type:complete
MTDDAQQIVTFDFETDPFLNGRIPQPFCIGFWDGDKDEPYLWEWGTAEDCVDFFFNVIEAYGPDYIFFAHNGGKFDLHFILPYADTITDVIMIGARIVQARINGVMIRDSYALIPVGLGKYQKDEIDYAKMEADVREEHKTEIIAYLKTDCRALYELVTGFISEFGLSLTMASAAMQQLETFHEYNKMQGDNWDARLRQFYYGGRVGYFEQGNLTGDFKVYDVNSMYPSVMKDYEHPISSTLECIVGKAACNDRIIAKGDFFELNATSEGAFPWRCPDGGGLTFPHGRKDFKITGHELRTAIELGCVQIHTIKRAWISPDKTNFTAFVEHFYNARQEAKKIDPKGMHQLFYKLVLNSAYGKFAQDPSKFKDFLILTNDEMPDEDGWLLCCPRSGNGVGIYERKSVLPEYLGRKNVATAASITGAARARLLEGLRNATRAVYCDTDSVICESMANVPMHPSDLGAWDCEATGDRLSVVGRKTYALWKDGKCVKKASKGVRAEAEEIDRAALGEIIELSNEAPTFSLKKAPHFISRKIRMT